jgi:hypothetical protein
MFVSTVGKNLNIIKIGGGSGARPTGFFRNIVALYKKNENITHSQNSILI